MNILPQLKAALDEASQHGAGLAERNMIGNLLIESGADNSVLHTWRSTGAFIHAEDVLPGQSVASFARAIGGNAPARAGAFKGDVKQSAVASVSDYDLREASARHGAIAAIVRVIHESDGLAKLVVRSESGETAVTTARRKSPAAQDAAPAVDTTARQQAPVPDDLGALVTAAATINERLATTNREWHSKFRAQRPDACIAQIKPLLELRPFAASDSPGDKIFHVRKLINDHLVPKASAVPATPPPAPAVVTSRIESRVNKFLARNVHTNSGHATVFRIGRDSLQ